MEKIEAEFQVFLSMEVNVGRGRIIVVVWTVFILTDIVLSMETGV
jgi:hypothetical protein